MKIPFFEFRLSKEHREELDESRERVFSRGIFIHGEELEMLENEIAQYLDVPHIIGVGNGYDALFISLKLISDRPLNVLIQANAYPATLNAVLNAGHNVIFSDIDFVNNGFSEIENAFLKRKNIDLIILTHFFGSATKIIDTIDKEIMLMEDFSQAFGSKFNGQFCGTFGKINAASLYPTKNLGAFGDAGIISTSDSEIYKQVKMYRNYGEMDYNNNRLKGVNSRMDEVQAAYLRVNLKRLSQTLKQKRSISAYYFEELKAINDLILPANNNDDTYHQFVIKTYKRDDLKAFLESVGITTKIHYPNPLFDQEAYKNLDFSNIDKLNVLKWHGSVLSLPSFSGLKIEEQEYICQKIKMFFS